MKREIVRLLQEQIYTPLWEVIEKAYKDRVPHTQNLLTFVSTNARMKPFVISVKVAKTSASLL